MPFSIIVATDSKGGFSKNNAIPWKIKADMRFFREITTKTTNRNLKNVLIMGRVTYEKIPANFRKLLGRIVIVVSKQYADFSNVEHTQFRNELISSKNGYIVGSFGDALDLANSLESVETIFVCGGERIYTEACEYPGLENVYLTEINHDFECDRFFTVPVRDWEVSHLEEGSFDHDGESISFCIKHFLKHRIAEDDPRYQREVADSSHQEYQYLNLISEILETGQDCDDRTGTGTLSLFGKRMEFDISESFPLFTTKRVAWKTCLRELLWMISGSTDATVLQKKNVHIWDGNTSREFLDSRMLYHLPEGDIGAGYGHQWRYSGAEYKTCRDKYTNQGEDQLQNVIRQLKEDPHSRRHLVVSWNPSDLKNMALPPCHCLFQFYVRNGEYLDCQLYQRSSDILIGASFNVASYACLTYMIASICDLKPGKFIHVLGDTHIYKNLIEAAKIQIRREPFPFPKLVIKNKRQDITEFTEDDFELVDYKCHAKIPMQMSV